MRNDAADGDNDEMVGKWVVVVVVVAGRLSGVE